MKSAIAPLFAIAIAAGAPAAWGGDAPPCSTLVVDSTAENGFAIGPGQSSLDLCSRGFVPALSAGFNCTWGDRYHVEKHATAWTATSNLPMVAFEFGFRRDAGGNPGAPVDPAPFPGDIPPPAQFPATTVDFEEPYPEFFRDSSRRLANRWLLRDDDPSVWACASLDQATAGRFVAVDRSAATPTQLCRVQVDGGGLWESCALQDPQLRALGLGARVAPIAGFGSSDQVVPPFAGPYTASIAAWYTGSPLPADPPPGDNFFRFRIEHDVPNPTAAHIHVGYPGQTGAAIVTFSDPTGPIDEDGFFFLPLEHEMLEQNQLYFDVHTAAHPEGVLRGQLIPAQPGIFADGFESGDTSGWSSQNP